MKSHCCIVVYGLVLSLSCFKTSIASATPLKPGTTTRSISKSNPIEGMMLFSTNINLTSSSFSGILASSVLMDDPGNPYGGLTFTYQLTCDAFGYTPVSSISINEFGSFLTSVSYESPTEGRDDPAQASRTEESLGVGTTVTFDFLTGLEGGQSSACLIIQTSAKSWTWSSGSACFGSCSTYTACPRPVPEPTGIGLLALGLGALGCSQRLARKLT
jgi:hypothetical protein